MAKDQELLQAVKSNDLSTFRKLQAKIKAAKSKKGGKKYNINIQDEDGFTAIHHASLTGNAEIVMGLLDMECDASARDKKGMCPLHLAAWSGKVEVSRLLIEAGVEVNVCSENGDTPLILACQHGNSEVADVLLDGGGSALIVNKNGEGSLDLACRFGHIHVVELLLKSREVKAAILSNSVKNHTEPPLHSASKTGHVEIVRMLLEADADINKLTGNGSALHEAALYGKTAVVKLLLDWGIDVNARNEEGRTALEAVNLFTSSKASADIKQLLKEAQAEEKTIHAKAVRDHFNMYDSTALQFKVGQTIIVLEQNSSGRWKGKVQNGEKEKVGFFPSNFVRIVTTKRTSTVKKSAKDTDAVPVGTYEMVALPSVPPSPGFQPRNCPRLSSFGKKERDFRNSDNEERSPRPPPAKKPHIDQVPAGNGLKPKGSIKIAGHGLQYVEVAVDKPEQVPWPTSATNHQTNSKTQYTEVVLQTPDASVEEVTESEEPPLLPDKQHKGSWSPNAAEDVWVRNTSTPPPSLAPKLASQTIGLPSDSHRPSPEPPRHHAGPAPRVATPELSRKGYEEMSFAPRPADETPDAIWEQQPVQKREHPRHPLPYENVNLPPRGKSPGELETMFISDIDAPGEGEDGYVIVNGPSHSKDARGYENVNPPSKKVLDLPHNNVSNDINYEAMAGGICTESAPQIRTGSPGDEMANHSDPQGYERMTGCSPPVTHQYVNIKRQGNAEGQPAQAIAHVPLKMRDYNALYDWLESFKLAIYIDIFVKGGFDMISLRGITSEDLTAMNVKKTGHRKKILAEAAKLEGTNSFPTEKPKDIMTWLQLIGLEQYIPEFIDGGFDDMEFVQDMTLEDLEAIGVTKLGHQRKIWMAVNALRTEVENENVVRSQHEQGTGRKGYLETSFDGEDSGVSTDEVDPPELLTGNNQAKQNETDISQVRSSNTVILEDSSENTIVEESGRAEKGVGSPEISYNGVEEFGSAAGEKEEYKRRRVEENKRQIEGLNSNSSSTVLQEDCPPPRPPLPQEDAETGPQTNQNKTESCPTEGRSHKEQTSINYSAPRISVKDLVEKENSRVCSSSVDSSAPKPKKPLPPVKPKSVKREPPKVAPKPRKSGSFSYHSDRSSGEESWGERSPTKTVDRRSNTGSSAIWSPASPSRPSGSRRSRSDSNSSLSSVDSLIEEIEERRRSFEKCGRKLSAPDRLSCEISEGQRRSQPVSRGTGLDEQIKQILRRRSTEELAPVSTETSDPSSSLHEEIGSESLNRNGRHKEQAMAEELIKDINNMLSDFSSELDSMFD